MLQSLLVLGNQLFHHVYFFCKPLYSLYKTVLDRGERTILRRIVRPGMIVVDIGANIGVFSRFLAGLVGVDGKVIAFEPSPDNFNRLWDNVAALPQVEAVHAAVGSSTGDIILFESGELNVDHRVYDTEKIDGK
jgi:tRNA A58 N-methylase Trm61